MTDKQITIKEITECGFYCSKIDVEHLYIYEVIKNKDEEWLKENPEATLLINEWIYDHTDSDDRKVYTTNGNLIAVCNDSSNCKVYKIEDTKYKIYGNCGQFLIEDKPTYKEQLKRKEQELKNICKAFDIEYLIDKETGDLIGRCNKLYKKEQECERLKNELSAYGATGICETCTEKSVLKYDQLEKENEKLKKERDTLSVTRNKLLGDLWVAEENLKDYIEHFNKASDELDQLKGVIKKYEECNKYLVEENGKTYTRLEHKLLRTLAEIKEIAKIKYPKSLFTETFVEVINHCPYFDCGNCKCLENKEKQNCGGFICSRKQSVYYQENTIYFKQILQKISKYEVKND